MTTKLFVVQREINVPAQPGAEGSTLGRIFCDGIYLGFTLEDEDRQLENHQRDKVYGRTAIPRGRYELALDYSPHFGKLLPHIKGVPTHDGIRIHGANLPEQLLGCIAVGLVRTQRGVAKCDVVLQRIIGILQSAENDGIQCYIEVK